MTAFSEEETNALVRGRIHDLEFQVWFTIDGVNFYDYCCWLDSYSIDSAFKELVYDTCFKSNIGIPDSKFYPNIIRRVHWIIWKYMRSKYGIFMRNAI